MKRLSSVLSLLPIVVVLVSCERDAVSIDPEVKQTVDKFWQSFISPDFAPDGRPLLKSAHEQLHPDAKQQSIEAFGKEWLDWAQRLSPGWVRGAEIESAEVASDSATVIVRVSLGEASVIEPAPIAHESYLRMTLRRHGSAWAVFRLDEQEHPNEAE